MGDPATVHSPEKIPFSWEKKAGVCKVDDGESFPREQEMVPKPKLPPPPYTTEGTALNSNIAEFQIPLPPCTFQPPYYRTSSKRGLIWGQEDDDPFLTAYKECTKTAKNSDNKNKKLSKTRGIESRLKASLLIFSCKRSCSVRDNNLVRISQLP
ncbi:hypothetical protein L6164_024556 [Bauhinia variegata]|uniref:Uncharacterized protein n=1 Tax=Bauhinia variegata TaxID=167791 RepID=A0ACB9LXW6_BAUVA|nr:hypothetical protein L6164_024556 [Bauhinia variegata]